MREEHRQHIVNPEQFQAVSKPSQCVRGNILGDKIALLNLLHWCLNDFLLDVGGEWGNIERACGVVFGVEGEAAPRREVEDVALDSV